MTQSQEKFNADNRSSETANAAETDNTSKSVRISKSRKDGEYSTADKTTGNPAGIDEPREDIETAGNNTIGSIDTAERAPVNFQYKARLFEMIFSRPEELLELYNAVNGSHYTDPKMLEVNTLKNALYMAMHNDISFILDTRLSLYEHQSTYNPSLPLRFLEYIADLYSALTKDENLYGRRQIKIAAPRFIIFYNGLEEQPDRKLLKLSDMFTVKEEHPSLELEAVMLNINRGHNPELMQTCKTLADYAEYTARVRTYAENISIEDAVEKAVSECIKENVLASFLSSYRAEAIKVSIYEYDEEKHMRQERQESFAEGVKEGLEKGLEKGIAQGRAEGIAEGRAEGVAEGRTEGIAVGRAEGIAEGRAEGIMEGKRDGAASMLYTLAAEGLLPIETAAEKAGQSVSFFREKMAEYLPGNTNAEK